METDSPPLKIVAPPPCPCRLEEQSIGLIPMRLVRATRIRFVDLGLFERFLLEAADAFGEFETGDIEAVTGLPPDAIDRGLWQLRKSGAIQCNDIEGGRSWRSCPEELAKTLERKTRAETFPDEFSFLAFPRSGEVFATHSRNQEVRKLEKIAPLGRMPALSQEVETSLQDWVAARLREDRIHGLPGDVTGLPGAEQSRTMLETCPRFAASIEWPEPDKNAPDVPLEEAPIRMTISDPTAERERTAVFHLPPEMDVVRAWRSDLDILSHSPIHARVAAALGLGKGGADLVSRGPDGGIGVMLSASGAEQLHHQRVALDLPFGVRIPLERGFLRVRGRFYLSDPEAVHWVGQDRLVTELSERQAAGETTEGLLARLRAGAAELGTEPETIRSRAWRLQRYPLVYRLRELEDFHGYRS